MKRPQVPRSHPSDTSAAEWALIEPLLTVPAYRTPRGGRPRRTRAGRPWTPSATSSTTAADGALPADFQPWRTVHGFFAR